LLDQRIVRRVETEVKPNKRHREQPYELVAQRASSVGASNQKNPFTRKKRNPRTQVV
jgi:hypothetical protein